MNKRLPKYIQHYFKKYRPDTQAEIECFAAESDLKSAIQRAALAKKPNGKKYSHQFKIKKSALQQAESTLLKYEAEIRECANFDCLLSLIEKLVEPIDGIGELYVYDTAFRIGAKLGIMPEKVYLHAGTRIGAKALGFSGEERAIDPASLPEEIRVLPAYEIEDFICLYKDRLQGMNK